MNPSEILAQGRRVANARLFDIAGTPIGVATIVTVVLILIGTMFLSRGLQAATTKALKRRGVPESSLGVTVRLLHYFVLLVGFGVAFETVGIDLSALFAAGAIFAVGIGFAMQSIAQNFVAGVILLIERAIKPGDVLEVEGQVVKVHDMGIRATIAQTRDGEDLIIPNSALIQSAVKNYTLLHTSYRVRVPVGVIYGSDMALVRRLLEDVAQKISAKWAVRDQKPRVLMRGFGDNSVNFEVAIWMSDPWEAMPATSELLELIWWTFKEKDVVIAFPQLDVHFDPTVTDGFSAMVGQWAKTASSPSLL